MAPRAKTATRRELARRDALELAELPVEVKAAVDELFASIKR
jgi:hypothetical protein